MELRKKCKDTRFPEKAVAPALTVIKSEIPFGFYWLNWVNNGDSDQELVLVIWPLALQFKAQNNFFLKLQNFPFTKLKTAAVLRDIAFDFRDQGDDISALNQLGVN